MVYDASRKAQSFYQGHKLKISAIAKHPFLRVAATGEVNVNPSIHVWDAQTLETLVVLPTQHKGGVLHLIFSNDGQKIVSVGMDRCFSIQIFIWRQKRSLAYRNSGYFPVFGIKFDPYEQSSFYTCGYQHLARWKVDGSNLTCVDYHNVYNTHVPQTGAARLDRREPTPEEVLEYQLNQKNILLCMDFISFRLGHSI